MSEVDRKAGALQERDRWLTAVVRRIEQHRGNLAGWQEPAGFLVPTEPDPKERAAIRERLMVASEELGRLAEELGVELGVEVPTSTGFKEPRIVAFLQAVISLSNKENESAADILLRLCERRAAG